MRPDDYLGMVLDVDSRVVAFVMQTNRCETATVRPVAGPQVQPFPGPCLPAGTMNIEFEQLRSAAPLTEFKCLAYIYKRHQR